LIVEAAEVIGDLDRKTLVLELRSS